MANEVKNTIVEIVDINTGEIVFESRLSRELFSYGLRGLDKSIDVFYKYLRSGRDCSINITCFDPVIPLDFAEQHFIINKHLDSVF